MISEDHESIKYHTDIRIDLAELSVKYRNEIREGIKYGSEMCRHIHSEEKKKTVEKTHSDILDGGKISGGVQISVASI